MQIRIKAPFITIITLIITLGICRSLTVQGNVFAGCKEKMPDVCHGTDVCGKREWFQNDVNAWDKRTGH